MTNFESLTFIRNAFLVNFSIRKHNEGEYNKVVAIVLLHIRRFVGLEGQYYATSNDDGSLSV